MPSNDIIRLSERESLLRATPTFQNLSVNELSQLASMMQEMSFDAGQTVITEGELIDSVYIIANGTLEVTKQVTYDGKSGSSFIAVLNTGDSIGFKEGGLFTETGRRTATITAITSCILLKIDIIDFDKFLKDHPQSLQSMKKMTDIVLRMHFIKESNPFMQLSKQRIAWLANSVKLIEVKPGAIIFKQNDTADNCYMIVEGEVEFSTQDENGKEKIINSLKTGELFGERAIFKDAKRAATARAVTACSLMVLDQDTLDELKEETAPISETILSQSSERNQPIRLENIIHQQRTMSDGQVITVLKDPIRNQYLQLNEEGWYVWKQLNGRLSVQDIYKQFAAEFNRSDPQEVIKIINTLIDAGFASADVMQAGEISTSKREAKQTIAERFHWIYAIKKSDTKFDKLYRYGGFVFFNIPSLVLTSIIIIAGLYFFSSTLNLTLHAIHNKTGLFFFLIWVAFICSILSLINPIAKALMIKRFNHSVPRFTINWQYILPRAFVDTSDIWLSSRLPRMMTMLSGLMATLLLASLLTLFVYFYPSSSLMLTASLCSIILYFLALRSLDPLLDSDGYLAISNALDAHKLRETALAFRSRYESNIIRKHNAIYYIYYFIYIVLNFLFIMVIQHQLLPYGLTWLWNGWTIYLILTASLFIEFLVELNYLNQMKKILATE